MTIFLFNGFNQQNKLSRVLDELGGILKKGKSSEFNPRHDGGFGITYQFGVH